MTHLLDAIFNCDLNKLKVLLPDKRAVNREIPGTEGCTPLHLAVGIENGFGKEHILSYLLEMGADPNARSYEELTPVHIAAMWNNFNELEKLLQSGGNPWLTDNENKNSFDLAINNHAYEAHQLLHLYLAGNKLNYKNGLSRHFNESTLSDISFKVNCTDLSKNENSNVFRSANENFPCYFSSDDSSVLSNVSKILKRNVLKSSNALKKVENSQAESECDIINENEAGKYLLCAENKITKRKMGTKDSPSYTLNFSDFWTNGNKADEEVVDTDNESAIALVLKTLPTASDSLKTFDSTISSDWKAFQSTDVSCSSTSSCSSHSIWFSDVPQIYKNLSNSQIWQELKLLGDNPGPVLDSTRNVYLQRLARLKSGCYVFCALPQPRKSYIK